MFTAINHQRRNGTIFHPLQFIKPLHDSNCCMVLRPVWLFVWWRGLIICMPKKFINPNWKELRKLPSKVREAYFYCWDKADACGVYEFDPVYFKADLGFILSPADLQLIPNIKKIASDKYLFTDYISINYGVLKEGYNPHKPVFRDLLKNNITLEFINFQARTKLEEEDKEEDEEVKGVIGEKQITQKIHSVIPESNKTDLQKHIEKSYPKVAAMKKQLTIEECSRLIGEFEKVIIDEVLQAMENKADLLKKYDSVNLTLRSWIKRRTESPKEVNKQQAGDFFDINKPIIPGAH